MHQATEAAKSKVSRVAGICAMADQPCAVRGGCNPGDLSQSLRCEAVSACRARRKSSSRAVVPWGSCSAASRKRLASSANRCSKVSIHLGNRRCCIALLQSMERKAGAQSGVLITGKGHDPGCDWDSLTCRQADILIKTAHLAKSLTIWATPKHDWGRSGLDCGRNGKRSIAGPWRRRKRPPN